MQTQNEVMTPAYTLELERAVIGALLIAPHLLAQIADVVHEKDFYNLPTQYAYKAIRQLDADGLPIDTLSVTKLVNDAGLPVKSMDFIGMMNNVGDTTAIRTYAELLKLSAIRREGVRLLSSMQAKLLNPSISTQDSISEFDNGWMGILNRATSSRTKTAEQSVHDYYDRLLQRMDGGLEKFTTTGYPLLDDALFGFERQRLYIFAGRPAMGKSMLFLNMIYQSLLKGIPIYIALTELSEEIFFDRFTVLLLNKALRQWFDQNRDYCKQNHLQYRVVTVAMLKRPNSLAKHERTQLEKVLTWLKDQNFIVDDMPEPTPSAIRANVARHVARNGIQRVFLDGIYHMRGDEHTNNRHLELASIVKHVRNTGRLYNVSIIASHQLSREVERRANKRPVMSDLRDSGGIEEEADAVVMLYRDAVYNPDVADPDLLELIMVKNRDGESNVVIPVGFYPQTMEVRPLTVTNHDLRDL